jgi:drug/metabolite transporter (DMT)-like permease
VALLGLNLVLGYPLAGYPIRTCLSFIALALVSQILGYLSINYALGYLPASVVAPTMLGQPVVTAILAGPLLGEVLSLWQVLGGIAVLVGVYVVHRSRRGDHV